jgi:hypothetical protein
MKLLTKAIEKNLEKTSFGTTDNLGKDAPIVVKFFNPFGSGTWLITEGEKQEDGDWLLFGACHIHEWEWGYVLLSELKNLRKFGRPQIERDYYPPKLVRNEWKD